MNRDLELLVSRAFDGGLAPEHREDLRSKSGLTSQTIADSFIRSVPPGMISRLLGFDLPSVRSALRFPYRSPAGGFMDHIRMKLFPPLTDAKGHSVKYLQPKRTTPRLYFVGTCLKRVLETDEPLWLCEGEKKTLAVAQFGKAAIGIAGVEGWHRRGEAHLLADFDEIPLMGRIVEVLPDGDVETNQAVRRAVDRLGDALAVRGAKPRLVHLPRELVR